MKTAATFALIIGFTLLLSGFLVMALPAKFPGDGDSGRRTYAGGYGFAPSRPRSMLAVRYAAMAGLIVGTILILGSLVYG